MPSSGPVMGHPFKRPYTSPLICKLAMVTQQH
jgi:hypothetical protein